MNQTMEHSYIGVQQQHIQLLFAYTTIHGWIAVQTVQSVTSFGDIHTINRHK